MQRHIDDGHAFLLQLIEDLRREVQPGCRCSCGTIYFGIDGLIAIRIIQLFPDIWGQRNISEFLKNLIENAMIDHLHLPESLFLDFDALCLESAIMEAHDCSELDRMSIAEQAFPYIIRKLSQQQHFHMCPGFFLDPVETGRDDSRIIADEDISFMEIIHDVIEMLMFQFSALHMDHHHPAGLAVLQRSLGNELLRELIIKITCLIVHRCLCVPAFLFSAQLS